MVIYPAIDIIDGKCVRLNQGDFDQKTQYNEDPVAQADSFADAGATWIHVVDLDGAKDRERRQVGLIEEICNASIAEVQTGGGVRSIEDVDTLVSAGADRVIVGSLAVKDTAQMRDILQAYGSEKVVLAADIKMENEDPRVMIQGWQDASGVWLWDLLEQFLGDGLKHVLCTDISRDGMLGGVNTKLYAEMQKRYPSLAVQASGGVGSIDDVKQLKTIGVAGVIIGKALYENKFTLEEALGC